MGTKLSGIIVGASEGAARFAWEDAVSLAGKLEFTLNRFDPASEVSRLVASRDGGPHPVSAALGELIAACNAYRERTGGLFDITKGTGGPVALQDGNADLQGASLDFGGIGKGWFLRGCRRILQEAGIRDAFICFGNSSILAMGHHPHGDSWKVSVIDPYTADALTERALRDSSLSVSGNKPGYEGHIVDPGTGRGVTGRRVTVVESRDPAEAEALSTAAMLADTTRIGDMRRRFPDADIQLYND